MPSLKFSRLASLSSRLPGRASQRVPAVTTFLARAQEQQPRSPAAGTRGRETREGFPAGAAPGWAGRDRAAWLHKHDGTELHTQLRARGCGPGGGGLRRPTHPLLPPRRPQKLAAGGPACAELQPPPARSPGVPSLAAPPAGLGRRPSNTTYPAPARPPASAVAPSFRRGPPPLGRLRRAQPPARTPGFFKNKQAPSLPPRCSRGFSQARTSRSLEVCWQGPSGTCVLSPAARNAAASARPAPLQSAWRALSPPCVSPPVLRCSVRIARL